MFKCHNDASATAFLQVVDRDARFVMLTLKWTDRAHLKFL